MKQRYNDVDVLAPGTVIISATANCSNITKVVEPVFKYCNDIRITLTFQNRPVILVVQR